MRPVERAGTGLKRSRRRAAEQLQRRAKHAGQTRGSPGKERPPHLSTRHTSSRSAPSSRQPPPQPACRRCHAAAACNAVGSGPTEAAAQQPSSSATMETMFTDCKRSSPVAVRLCLIRTAARSAAKKYKQLGILRAKVPRDGWEWGEGERTLLSLGNSTAAKTMVPFFASIVRTSTGCFCTPVKANF